MQLGRTSIIYYISKLTASILGFAATIYIARTLGPEPLGIYHVAIGLISWLAILGNGGISNAAKKRVSEGVNQGAYTVASVVLMSVLFLFVAASIVLFQSSVVAYIGYPATNYLLLIMFFTLFNGLLSSLLEGLRLVHLSGLLAPLRTGGRSLAQILLVSLGVGTASLLIGHILGYIAVVVIGAYYVSRNLPRLAKPEKEHFKHLTEFAKFSWLGGLQSQMFSYTDILVLRIFVTSGLIGVYAAAWNIAHFLILFSGTLRATLFPEMSAMSSEEDPQAIARIVEQSLTFTGLFLVPGLFGGALLGNRILRIYGPEFPKGAGILVILIVANLLMGYQHQLLNTLEAIDRPDLAFRSNITFVGANILLNFVLVYLFGWVGAAVATAVSVVISLVLAYQYVNSLIDFNFPFREISKQWIAALAMSVVVYAGLAIESVYGVLQNNVAVVLSMVLLGGAVYFAALFGISIEFRETVERNLPAGVPFSSRGS